MSSKLLSRFEDAHSNLASIAILLTVRPFRSTSSVWLLDRPLDLPTDLKLKLLHEIRTESLYFIIVESNDAFFLATPASLKVCDHQKPDAPLDLV